MAKFERTPKYKDLYPQASEEVIHCLKVGHRKMQYAEYDLKVARCKVDFEKEQITYIPSREDSLERLIEAQMQFPAEIEDIAEQVVRKIMIEKLRLCLNQLTKPEQALIEALFFSQLTERAYAKKSGIPQKTINDRRHRTLLKLKKLLTTEKGASS